MSKLFWLKKEREKKRRRKTHHKKIYSTEFDYFQLAPQEHSLT